MSEPRRGELEVPRNGPLDRVWVGFGTGAGVNLIALALLNRWGDSSTALFLFCLIGMTQLAWMCPILILLGRRYRAQRGVVLAIGATFLLNVSCGALVGLLAS